MRLLTIVVFIWVFVAPGVAHSQEADEGKIRERQAECIPVMVSGPDGSGPGLAVLQTKVKPSKTRVFLDGRFVGRAKLLDGRPDFLYLRPGSYRLELRFGGYRSEAFLIEVGEQPCRFNIKHKMERVKGTEKEKASGQGVLMGERIWEPVE